MIQLRKSTSVHLTTSSLFLLKHSLGFRSPAQRIPFWEGRRAARTVAAACSASVSGKWLELNNGVIKIMIYVLFEVCSVCSEGRWVDRGHLVGVRFTIKLLSVWDAFTVNSVWIAEEFAFTWLTINVLPACSVPSRWYQNRLEYQLFFGFCGRRYL